MTNLTNKSIVKAIQFTQTASSMSIAELASALGISIRTLREYIKDPSRMQLKTILKLQRIARNNSVSLD